MNRTFVTGITVLIISIVCLAFALEKTHIEKRGCYDKNGAKIIGLECEREIPDDLDGVLIGLIGMLGGFITMMVGIIKWGIYL